jgi:hypothetical protein
MAAGVMAVGLRFVPRVSRAQRSMKRSGMMRCRPGTVTHRDLGGPGSAVHRFALHRVRDTHVHGTNANENQMSGTQH